MNVDTACTPLQPKDPLGEGIHPAAVGSLYVLLVPRNGSVTDLYLISYALWRRGRKRYFER